MSLEPPYGAIWRELHKGKVVPFLGAGASLSGRSPDAKWDEESPSFLPSGQELAHLLAMDASFPSENPQDLDDLPKVASYYLEAVDRANLRQRLRDVFNREYQPSAIHRFLAELEVPLLIVTTNYDDLIEQAFRNRSKPYHLVVHPTDRADLAASVLWWKPGESKPTDCHPNSLELSLEDVTIIYKMHGSVYRQTEQWDSYVITEEDYVDFLTRMTGQKAVPASFMMDFRSRRFLFLGYGLQDWNLRVMLKSLKDRLGQQAGVLPAGDAAQPAFADSFRSWAIQKQPSELEKALWRGRQVNIYDMSIDEFEANMRRHQP